MRLQKNQKVLFDAQAIIELHAWNLWDRVVGSCKTCVSSIIREEAYFHSGNQAINLQPQIDAGTIEEVEASVEELDAFRSFLSDQFLFGIDEGEEEALAIVMMRKRESFLFCTADAQAIKCLGVLSLRDKGLSMEALFQALKIRYDLPSSRKEKYFKKYLDQGFMESDLYKRR